MYIGNLLFLLYLLFSKTEIKEKILRIGAIDYEPLQDVKKHTLDERLKEELG